MCARARGCRHEPLAGTDAVLSGLDALDSTIRSAPLQALGSAGSTDRLEKLVADARGLLAPAPGVRPLAGGAGAGGTRLARRNPKRAERKLAALVRAVGHGMRRRATRPGGAGAP